jgi:hypothetical protein
VGGKLVSRGGEKREEGEIFYNIRRGERSRILEQTGGRKLEERNKGEVEEKKRNEG